MPHTPKKFPRASIKAECWQEQSRRGLKLHSAISRHLVAVGRVKATATNQGQPGSEMANISWQDFALTVEVWREQ